MAAVCLSEGLHTFIKGIKERHPGDREFHQAVFEVAQDIIPFMDKNPIYREKRIFERLTEADRIIIFRVTWEDDQGVIHTNRGYRIQHSNAIGPYKGGIRFRAPLRLSVLKALAFEQTFKNSLTGLPMGGAKGGANFNPKGKSDREIMKFCQQYMTELSRYIGPNLDIPAGDIGVGEREISYMFGQYKKIKNEFSGALTGKGVSFGGSLIRKEATGYGCAYMLEFVLKEQNQRLEGKSVAVSGAGNVAIHAIEKLVNKGANVITVSDSSGFVYAPKGLAEKDVEELKILKFEKRGRISQFAKDRGLRYFSGKKPWAVPCDIALPCAIQNEISDSDAKTLIMNGCRFFLEGANIPCTPEAVHTIMASKRVFIPGKAANAGGVAVSGLELTQNSMRLSWTEEELDLRLKEIMADIHATIVKYGREHDGYVNYKKGANIGAFLKVADAMLSCGTV
ncbi:NADP-specific glutamate dehydrogenase [Dissulfuribacter thermophilus]|uniref:Glutamate dehydrogenase n=1 Tax=Dissulfuribacter thermophilus TaxID=1156395 RepID=A0A1B9F5D3_9BACT|nr:NADP-specific glutamate dehydrogenase [Dissulfuribacter thermophilus]OCC15158.1 NADP-specific glutamate dehydrogenase [Dissulfuribacter thermophilus]